MGNGKNVKTRTAFLVRYGHLWTKKSPKTVIFPNALFLHFPSDLPSFSAEGPILNATKGTFFTRGPNPKVLIMRWKRS